MLEAGPDGDERGRIVPMLGQQQGRTEVVCEKGGPLGELAVLIVAHSARDEQRAEVLEATDQGGRMGR